MSETDSTVGVITGIDGIDANDIDKDIRKKWVRQLQDELETLTGLEEVVVASAAPDFTEVLLVAVIDSEESYSGYTIDHNLRSLSQLIRHTLSDDVYASANILEPEVIPPEKDGQTYKADTYEITVYYP